MEIPEWFQELRSSNRVNPEKASFNDYRDVIRFFSIEEKRWLCGVHNGDIKCDDPRIRKPDYERPAKGIQKKKTITQAAASWYGQWNIPGRTFRNWFAIYLDPRKGFRNGPGNPPKLDSEARLEIQRKLRDLQFGADGNGPRPAKTSTLHEIMIKGAESTLIRTGVKLKRQSDPVTMAISTEKLYRLELAQNRSAADLTDARYKALSDMHHIFQYAVMIIAFSGHLWSYAKANLDFTTFELRRDSAGKVRRVLEMN